MNRASGNDRPFLLGRRVTLASMLVNLLLSGSKIAIGLMGGSTSLLADGLESGSDILASGLVFAGLWFASRPPDPDHPYGYGRAEILSGFIVGLILLSTGVGICVHSLRGYGLEHEPPAFYTIWPLIASILLKMGMMSVKFRFGRRLGSSALLADGWNDAVDILSGSTALTALGLTLFSPVRFLAADHFGGFAVGIIVAGLGIRVARDTSLDLLDRMPPVRLMSSIRASAQRVEGVLGVEKCWARKTGLRYHVDLHLEVCPLISVADGHAIAERVRQQIRGDLPLIADVLVHVEPASEN